MTFLEPKKPERPDWRLWLPELCGAVFLAALLAYFLRVSWRKWPDPIIDSGPQWYAAWQISDGRGLFQGGGWNYGPLSAYLNGLLFKIFGATLTVLFAANLLVYAAILSDWPNAAFRRAWGRMGARSRGLPGCSLPSFSFSHLTSVGNYNLAVLLTYSHEATQWDVADLRRGVHRGGVESEGIGDSRLFSRDVRRHRGVVEAGVHAGGGGPGIWRPCVANGTTQGWFRSLNDAFLALGVVWPTAVRVYARLRDTGNRCAPRWCYRHLQCLVAGGGPSD